MIDRSNLNPRFQPGAWVIAAGELWCVISYAGTESVRLRRPGESETTLPESVIKEMPGTSEFESRLRPFEEYPLAAQAIALQLQEVLRNCLAEGWTKEAIKAFASLIGKSFRTAMRIVDRYILCRERAVALIPNALKYGTVHNQIKPEAMSVILEGARLLWFVEERSTGSALLEWIETRCRNLNIKKIPSRSTVIRILAKIPPKETITARHGRKVARDMFRPLAHSAPVSNRPFGKVEIDHTPINVFIVLPSGKKVRVWLTLAIDLYTRMVVGFYLGIEAPSRYLVSMCLYRVMTEKESWLREHGILTPWPCIGVPEIVQTDSAKEFLSEDFGRIALAHNIKLQKRPRGKCDFGGFVERMMGRAALAVQILPGKTFRNIVEKGDYKAEDCACLNFEELEKYLLHYFIEEYHHSAHRGLRGRSPISIWNKWHKEHQGETEFPRQVAQAPMNLKLGLLPSFTKTIQQGGITHRCREFNDPSLIPWIRRKNPKSRDGKHRFHFDPRYRSTTYWQDPETNIWHRIPQKDWTAGEGPEWDLYDLLETDRERAKETVNTEIVDRGRKGRYGIHEKAIARLESNQREIQKNKSRAGRKAAGPSVGPRGNPGNKNTGAIEQTAGFDALASNMGKLDELPLWGSDYIELK